MEEDALDPNSVPDGWLPNDNPSSPPTAKKKKLSLTKKAGASHSTAVSTSRFAPPVPEVQFTEAAKGVVPMNKKTSFVKDNFFFFAGGGDEGSSFGKTNRQALSLDRAHPLPFCCDRSARISPT